MFMKACNGSFQITIQNSFINKYHPDSTNLWNSWCLSKNIDIKPNRNKQTGHAKNSIEVRRLELLMFHIMWLVHPLTLYCLFSYCHQQVWNVGFFFFGCIWVPWTNCHSVSSIRNLMWTDNFHMSCRFI